MTQTKPRDRFLAALFSCAAIVLAVAGCSSDGADGGGNGSAPSGGGAAGTGSGVDSIAPSATVDGGGTPGSTSASQSPDAFAEYYRKLGVGEPVVTCYVAALTEIGVTSLDQLESDQALALEAADRFDQCVVDVGGGAPTGATA